MTDSDHVVARCFFNQGMLSNNSLLVRACTECHNKKNVTDQALRDALALDFSLQGHSAQADLFPKVLRAHRSRRSVITKDQVLSATPQDICTKSGIIIGRGMGIRINGNQLTEAIEWIIRGLCCANRTKRLDMSSQIKCERLMPGDDIKRYNKLTQKFNMNGPYSMGDTFAYSYAYEPKTPQWSVWFLQFYGRICYCAVTMPGRFNVIGR